jgi:Ca2+-binding EF-hand superfamily protein
MPALAPSAAKVGARAPLSHIGLLVDTNGDGIGDAIGYDTTGDGTIDCLDTNGDGIIDVVLSTPMTIPGKAASAAALPRGLGSPQSSAASPSPLPSLLRSMSGLSGSPGHSLLKQLGTANSVQQIPVPVESSDSGDVETSTYLEIFERIDVDGDGAISMLRFLTAAQRDSKVAGLFLPGLDKSRLLKDEYTFDQVDATFKAMAAGKKRVLKKDFLEYLRRPKADQSTSLRKIFQKIDADGDGSISRLELLEAARKDPEIAKLVNPAGYSPSSGMEGGRILRHLFGRKGWNMDQDGFDAVSEVFGSIAGGKKRAEYNDFETYFTRSRSLNSMTVDRSQQRLLLIRQGFEVHPQLSSQICQAGFKAMWAPDLPAPSQVTLPDILARLKHVIDETNPNLIVCAAHGSYYIAALWQSGIWRGPTLIIAAHPCLGEQIPPEVRVVVAHGANDEVCRRTRLNLESLVSTSSPNQSFLYYAGQSGLLGNGQRSREGDTHAMASLLSNDCLARLIDAAISEESPDVHMIRSWASMLSERRIAAERRLGYTLDCVRRRWQSRDRQGEDEKQLFAIACNSEEFATVSEIFKAAPRETPAYQGCSIAAWEKVQVTNVERVENGAQEAGAARSYAQCMKRSLEDQGLCFEAGVHTRWAFHGTAAVESIVSNPMSGFQPLASGTRGASLWGPGTYFARDAKYVADGPFCGEPAADGSRRMLMCLLTSGMPCLGDPQNHGVLPVRQGMHRYDSTVDSLSSPEIFIVQHPGAAYPAYVITFK